MYPRSLVIFESQWFSVMSTTRGKTRKRTAAYTMDGNMNQYVEPFLLSFAVNWLLSYSFGIIKIFIDSCSVFTRFYCYPLCYYGYKFSWFKQLYFLPVILLQPCLRGMDTTGRFSFRHFYRGGFLWVPFVVLKTASHRNKQLIFYFSQEACSFLFA